jgi:hypothetical protein
VFDVDPGVPGVRCAYGDPGRQVFRTGCRGVRRATIRDGRSSVEDAALHADDVRLRRHDHAGNIRRPLPRSRQALNTGRLRAIWGSCGAPCTRMAIAVGLALLTSSPKELLAQECCIHDLNGDLAQCQVRREHEGYLPSTNGCGPQSVPNLSMILDFVAKYGPADFTRSCDDHDRCYGTCDVNRRHVLDTENNV